MTRRARWMTDEDGTAKDDFKGMVERLVSQVVWVVCRDCALMQKRPEALEGAKLLKKAGVWRRRRAPCRFFAALRQMSPYKRRRRAGDWRRARSVQTDGIELGLDCCYVTTQSLAEELNN